MKSVVSKITKTNLVFAIGVTLFIAACGGGGGEGDSTAKETPKTTAAAQETPKADGEKVWRTYCITCHGIDGKLALNGAKDLSISEVSREDRIVQVTKGKNLMTPFEGILTEEQIEAVVDYTFTFKEE